MKVLFATTNPAKVGKYGKKLEEKGIEVLTLKDIDKSLHVEESGKNALENAYIKAKAYFDETNIITIGMDNNLYIEELPEEKQPGTYVRRINGKELSDDEMIEYYTNLVKDNGGKLSAKWVYGMVVYNGQEKKEYTWSKSNFYFVDTPCETRTLGYPLDSIAIIPEFDKYLSELSKEEKEIYNAKNKEEDVVDFVVDALKELKIMDEIVFVTHNKGKAKSAEKHFENIKFSTYDFELDEPRSDDLKEIATAKVKQAYEVVKKPCIALDTGFFIDELNGFPKAFVNFSLETIGIEGILKLMEGKENRSCRFEECLAYHDGNEIHYFYGKHYGNIAEQIAGKDRDEKWSDLWYIYKPEGYDKTLAEMTQEEKENRKRYNSVDSMGEFAKWYKENSNK